LVLDQWSPLPTVAPVEFVETDLDGWHASIGGAQGRPAVFRQSPATGYGPQYPRDRDRDRDCDCDCDWRPSGRAADSTSGSNARRSSSAIGWGS